MASPELNKNIGLWPLGASSLIVGFEVDVTWSTSSTVVVPMPTRGLPALPVTINISFNQGDVLQSSIYGGKTTDQSITLQTSGSANVWKFTDSNQLSGSASSTGSFGAGYIDNKLGIGTKSPGAALDIVGNSQIKLDVSSINNPEINFGDADAYIEYEYAGLDQLILSSRFNIDFRTEAAVKARIDRYGNFGIGTTSPS